MVQILCKLCLQTIPFTGWKSHITQKQHLQKLPFKIVVTGHFSEDNIDDVYAYFMNFGGIRTQEVTNHFKGISIEYRFWDTRVHSEIIHQEHILFGHEIEISWYKTVDSKCLEYVEQDLRMCSEKFLYRKLALINEIRHLPTFSNQLTLFQSKLEVIQKDMKTKRLKIYSDLTNAFGAELRRKKIHFYGSSITDLCLHDSNLNIYIDNMKNELSNLQLLVDLITKCDNFVNISLVENTVKCWHKQTQTCCKIDIKNELPVGNNELLKYFMTLDKKLTIFTILVKFWADCHDFRSGNAFCSYAICLMVVFYLQHPPYNLPAVRDLQKDLPCDEVDGWNCVFGPVEFSSPALETATILELLSGFFTFYGCFDYEIQAVSPYFGCDVKKTELFGEKSINSGIFVQDPFEHSKNVTSAVTLLIAGKFTAACRQSTDLIVANCEELLYNLLTFVEDGKFWFSKNDNYSEQEWVFVITTLTEKILKEICGSDVEKVSSDNSEIIYSCKSQSSIRGNIKNEEVRLVEDPTWGMKLTLKFDDVFGVTFLFDGDFDLFHIIHFVYIRMTKFLTNMTFIDQIKSEMGNSQDVTKIQGPELLVDAETTNQTEDSSLPVETEICGRSRRRIQKDEAENVLKEKLSYKARLISEAKTAPTFSEQISLLVEIIDRDKPLIQTKSDEICQDLQSTLTSVSQGITIFGSTVSNLCNYTSSLDFFVDVETTDESKVAFLLENSEKFRVVFSRHCITCRHIHTDQMCIIHTREKARLIGTTERIKDYVNLHVKVRELILFLRFWSNCISGLKFARHILDLMVIFFLQQEPYKLPPINDMQNTQDVILQNFSILELVEGFFNYFGKFDYISHIMSPFSGRVIEKGQYPLCNVGPWLSMEDPTMISGNIVNITNCNLKSGAFAAQCRTAVNLMSQETDDIFSRLMDDLYKQGPNFTIQKNTQIDEETWQNTVKGIFFGITDYILGSNMIEVIKYNNGGRYLFVLNKTLWDYKDVLKRLTSLPKNASAWHKDKVMLPNVLGNKKQISQSVQLTFIKNPSRAVFNFEKTHFVYVYLHLIYTRMLKFLPEGLQRVTSSNESVTTDQEGQLENGTFADDVKCEDLFQDVINKVAVGSTFNEQISIFIETLDVHKPIILSESRQVRQDLGSAFKCLQEKITIFGSSVSNLCTYKNTLDVYVDPTELGINMEFLLKDSGNFKYFKTQNSPDSSGQLISCKHIRTRRRCIIHTREKTRLVGTTERIRDYVKLDVKVRQLMMVVRFWADCSPAIKFPKHIFDLLVIFFLQQEPYNLPAIKDMQGAKNVTINASILELMEGFFVFYGNFDYFTYIISPYSGRTFKKGFYSMSNQSLPGFTMEDPLMMFNNIIRPQFHDWCGIFASKCREAAKCLSKEEKLHVLLAHRYENLCKRSSFEILQHITDEGYWLNTITTIFHKIIKVLMNGDLKELAVSYNNATYKVDKFRCRKNSFETVKWVSMWEADKVLVEIVLSTLQIRAQVIHISYQKNPSRLVFNFEGNSLDLYQFVHLVYTRMVKFLNEALGEISSEKKISTEISVPKIASSEANEIVKCGNVIVDVIEEESGTEKYEREVNQPESEVKNLETEVKQPESEVNRFEIEVKQPESDVQRLEIEVQQPESEVKQTGSEVKRLEIEVKQTGSEVKRLEIEVKEPESDVKRPETEVHQPESEDKRPEIGVKNFEIEAEKPESKMTQPKSEVKRREIEMQQPESEEKQLEIDTKKPESEIKQPEIEVKQSESEITELENEVQPLESKVKQPEIGVEQPKSDPNCLKREISTNLNVILGEILDQNQSEDSAVLANEDTLINQSVNEEKSRSTLLTQIPTGKIKINLKNSVKENQTDNRKKIEPVVKKKRRRQRSRIKVRNSVKENEISISEINFLRTEYDVLQTEYDNQPTFAEQAATFVSSRQSWEKNKLQLLETDLESMLKHEVRLYFLFGSNITNTDINSVNVYIETGKPNQPEVNKINRLKYLLISDSGKFKYVFTERSKVTFTHVESQLSVIFHLKDSFYIYNTKLIDSYINLDENLFTAMMVIKTWATRTTDISKHFSVDILAMIFVFFLQHEYKLPAVEKLQICTNAHIISDWNCAFTSPTWKLPEKTTVLDIVKDFFKYYGDFDFFSFVVAPYFGSPIAKTRFLLPFTLPGSYRIYMDKKIELKVDMGLCVQAPFEHTQNMSSLVSFQNASKFAAYCRHSFKIMQGSEERMLHRLLTQQCEIQTAEFCLILNNTRVETVKNLLYKILTKVIGGVVQPNRITDNEIQYLCQIPSNILDGRIQRLKNALKVLKRSTSVMDKEIAVTASFGLCEKLNVMQTIVLVRFENNPLRVTVSVSGNSMQHFCHFIYTRLMKFMDLDVSNGGGVVTKRKSDDIDTAVKKKIKVKPDENSATVIDLTGEDDRTSVSEEASKKDTEDTTESTSKMSPVKEESTPKISNEDIVDVDVKKASKSILESKSTSGETTSNEKSADDVRENTAKSLVKPESTTSSLPDPKISNKDISDLDVKKNTVVELESTSYSTPILEVPNSTTDLKISNEEISVVNEETPMKLETSFSLLDDTINKQTINKMSNRETSDVDQVTAESPEEPESTKSSSPVQENGTTNPESDVDVREDTKSPLEAKSTTSSTPDLDTLEDDIPSDFFDDFANEDFLNGLDVIDSLVDDLAEHNLIETPKNSDSRNKRERSRSRSRDRKEDRNAKKRRRSTENDNSSDTDNKHCSRSRTTPKRKEVVKNDGSSKSTELSLRTNKLLMDIREKLDKINPTFSDSQNAVSSFPEIKVYSTFMSCPVLPITQSNQNFVKVCEETKTCLVDVLARAANEIDSKKKEDAATQKKVKCLSRCYDVLNLMNSKNKFTVRPLAGKSQVRKYESPLRKKSVFRFSYTSPSKYLPGDAYLESLNKILQVVGSKINFQQQPIEDIVDSVTKALRKCPARNKETVKSILEKTFLGVTAENGKQTVATQCGVTLNDLQFQVINK